MSRLYVANVTKQNCIVFYRLDYDRDGNPVGGTIFRPPTQQQIPSGRQVPLGGDLHSNQIASIILQLQKYGLVNEDELKRCRGKITWVANVDRPVSAESIRYANDHNDGLKMNEGALRRRKAAVAASSLVQTAVAGQEAPQPPLQEFELSYEQEEQSEAGERRVEEGFRVPVADSAAPGGPPAETPRGGRRGRKAA
jgi:hypothetical protein